MFAIKAFRHYWRHQGVAVLATTTTPKVRATFEIMEPEEVAPVIAAPSDKVSPLDAAFFVTSGDVEQYKGSSGGDAKRAIETLRARGVEWEAFRSGEKWDWGPR